MSEAKLAEEFDARAKQLLPNCHISFVESPITSPGIPDVDFCHNGIETNVELKFSANGLSPEIGPTQVRWFKKRIAAGGKPWILAKLLVEGDFVYYLIEGENIEELARSSGLKPWFRCAYRIYDGEEMAQGGWASIFHVITEPY